jgi:hypothetical protein
MVFSRTGSLLTQIIVLMFRILLDYQHGIFSIMVTLSLFN